MTVGTGLYLSPAERDQNKINNVVRQLIEGRFNNIFSASINSGASSTVITSGLIGPNSQLVPVPLTANAAAQMTMLRPVSVSMGTATLAHGNNTNSDQNFNFIVIG